MPRDYRNYLYFVVCSDVLNRAVFKIIQLNISIAMNMITDKNSKIEIKIYYIHEYKIFLYYYYNVN